MSDEKQETKDDILAELRRQSNKEHALATRLRSGDCDDVDYACASCYDEDAKYLSQIADRLEATAKREKAQPGNAEAMREALIEIRDICQRVAMDISPTSKRYKSQECQAVNHCFRNAVAALSAPPRNCDLARDWLKDLYCNFKPPATVRREMPPEWVDAVMAFCKWIIAPAAELKGESREQEGEA